MVWICGWIKPGKIIFKNYVFSGYLLIVFENLMKSYLDYIISFRMHVSFLPAFLFKTRLNSYSLFMKARHSYLLNWNIRVWMEHNLQFLNKSIQVTANELRIKCVLINQDFNQLELQHLVAYNLLSAYWKRFSKITSRRHLTEIILKT